MRRIMTAAALAVLSMAGVLVVGAPAQAAGTCNRTVQLRVTLRTDYTAAVVTPSNGSTTASTSCYMAQTAQSSGVRALQDSLNHCYGPGSPYPVFSPALVLDSDFGAKTVAALKKAQSKALTTPDGEYGPLTRDALVWFAQRGGSWYCFGLDQPLALY